MPRKNGIYLRGSVYYVAFENERGEIIRKSSETSDPREAEKFLDRCKAGVTRRTWAEVCGLFFQTQRMRPKTRENYQSNMRMVAPVLGGKHIDEISVDTISDLVIRRKAAGVGHRAIDADLKFVSTVLTFAISLPNSIEVNPVMVWRTKNKKALDKPKPRTRYVREDEAERLLRACGPRLLRQIVIAHQTGMRPGEVNSLRWDQIDWQRGEIILDVVRTKDAEPRRVPMTDLARDTLRDTPNYGEYVWSTKGGRRIKSNRKAWDRLRAKLGVENLHFHDLRNTFGSWFIQRGGSQKALKDIFGHSTLKMTDKYMYLETEHLHQALEIFQERAPKIASRRSTEIVANSPIVTDKAQNSACKPEAG